MSTEVSIIIPCYNHGNYLAEAIESAIMQEASPTEIVVIDDGSSDDSAAIALGFQSRVTYRYQTNSGLPAARNAGARLARGKYLIFLDADDLLHGSYVRRTLEVLQESRDPRLAFVYTDIELFGREQRTVAVPSFSTLGLLTDNYVHASALINADLVRRFPYDETIRTGLEDWDFYLTLCENGYIGQRVPAPLLMYRQHELARSMNDRLRKAARERRRLRIAWRHRRLYARYRTRAVKAFLRRSLDLLRG